MGGAPAFPIGSRVRLTDRYARALSNNRMNFNWAGREGVVVKCSKRFVSVMWDGRKSLDWLPVEGVELVK